MKYKSSLTEMDRFLGSHVYEDMVATFDDWVVGVQEKLETTTDVAEMWRCQGRIQVLKDVLLWPENFRDVLEEIKDDNQ